ncbi:uncharacterized protein LOC128671000 isoform X2 [Plodia interpunctella]|uniref:uncharacterized protein LOC128671000 isoform X2 n=1 Tax=Plodia interpunctella TaxID=58824 RepID=UPI002367492F|nr:uncharacterized protein LOC128671000 isoform X2 [Plodia interpunctella]
MHHKILYAALVALLVLNTIEGRKYRRNKRPKEEEDTTLQPSVVSYSTFGFNDVGSYDGFVPSSPDYANYLNTVNQESATRLYAPAFPTASDDTGFDHNFGSPSNGYSLSDPDSGQQPSMMAQTGNFFNMPQFDNNDNQHNKLRSLTISGQYVDDDDAPVYGTKLGSKSKKQTNSTEEISNFDIGNPSAVSMNFNFQTDSPFIQNMKQTAGESHNNFNNVHTPPSYSTEENENFAESANNNGMLKFPKVVDFTKMNYPTEIENKFLYTSYNPTKNLQNEKRQKNIYDDQSNKYMQQTTLFKEMSNSDTQDLKENSEKQTLKKTSYAGPEANYVNTPPPKNIFKGTPFKADLKDYKNKYLLSNYSELKHWENPFKGYKYATNYSSTSFKFDSDEPKKQTSNHFEELIPASSNNVDLNNYQIPDTDFYTNFKKMPEMKPVYENEYDVSSLKEKRKPEEFGSQIKNAFSDEPIATSQWGNIYKSTEYSSHKNHPRKPIYTEDPSNDVVHIPKRPKTSKYHYGKSSETSSSGSSDWASYSKRPSYTKNRPNKDWYRDNYNTKFKTEEDLLDLRNHDTSNPSYLPTYNRPNDNEISSENDYKKLVEKWRQSYWKAKFREAYPDFVGYSSESKPLHVPIPKPYPIEVPHPVIVPVPHPYPVKVPVPKPVAVPVIRELTVAVEKPVPYPVIKKVAVPVEKPYPVHIPHVRPVFHHSKPPRDEFEMAPEDEDDYFPRPEAAKKPALFKTKPKSTRNRQHRPTRMTYQDRNVRRPRRPTDSHEDVRRPRRPYSSQIGFHYLPYRYRDVEMEYESEPSSDYIVYCKRTGNC